MKEQIAKKNKISMEMVNKIYAIFMELDADGSGFLEKEEFVNLLQTTLRAIAGDLTQKRIDKFWKEIDADGSGQVDFQEYADWYVKYLMDKGGRMKSLTLDERIRMYNGVPAEEEEITYPS